MLVKTKVMRDGFESWDEYSTDGKTYSKLMCRDGHIRGYLNCSKKEYEKETGRK